MSKQHLKNRRILLRKTLSLCLDYSQNSSGALSPLFSSQPFASYPGFVSTLLYELCLPITPRSYPHPSGAPPLSQRPALLMCRRRAHIIFIGSQTKEYPSGIVFTCISRTHGPSLSIVRISCPKRKNVSLWQVPPCQDSV